MLPNVKRNELACVMAHYVVDINVCVTRMRFTYALMPTCLYVT